MSGWTFRRTASLLLAAALAGAALPTRAQAAHEQALETDVKAAFLYRFLAFIEWPATAFQGAQSPYVVGFIGAEQVAQMLEKAAPGRTVQGRPLVVRRMKGGEPLTGVHFLMVGRGEQERMAQLAKAAAAQNVLVVGEAEDALDRGAAINFVIDDGRVRFEVSLPAVEKSGARISSRMLAVAHRVRDKP